MHSQSLVGRRRRILVPSVGLLLTQLVTTDANAACRFDSYRHTVGIKEINTNVYATPGGRCVFRIRPCGHCAVLSVNIVRRPRLGALNPLEGLRVEYRAIKLGDDRFTLRWCESPARKGCYLVHYHVRAQ